MAYTTIDDPTIYFNTILYTGNGANSHARTGVGFSPNWVWIKNREASENHSKYDTVRGANKVIYSNLNNAENNEANGVLSFDSDGFTVGNNGSVNGNNQSQVAWNWKAGGSGSQNTDGDLTVTSLSVNQTAGFSIGKITNGFTSTGSNSETVGHGLGAVPKMIILKNTEATSNWFIYHAGIGNTNRIFLNTTDASSSSTIWNNTTPTSSVWSVRGGDFGTGEDIVFYAFAEKKGYSKFGSYTGNGNANGTFVYTGFKPAFVMTKRTDGSDWWGIWDSKRDSFNEATKHLRANTSDAENPKSIDILSNGFKLLNTDPATNASGGTYIFMAFSSEPFTTSTGVPATAR